MNKKYHKMVKFKDKKKCLKKVTFYSRFRSKTELVNRKNLVFTHFLADWFSAKYFLCLTLYLD